MAHTHRVEDQFPPDTSAVLSDDQFEKLTAMLEAQHELLESLIKPIHDIAILLLADHAGGTKDDGEKA
jgi:hypothetical protein